MKSKKLNELFVIKMPSQPIVFLVQIVFFLSLFNVILPIHQVSASICYDVTTDHKCPEDTRSVRTDVFNNSNLQLNHSMWTAAKSFFVRQNCGTASHSETNIIDIHHVIENAQLDRREEFVCKMKVRIKRYMEDLLKDREFMKDYIERKKSNAFISKADKIEMTSLLMRYRLLRNKEDICSPYATGAGECYFSSARFSVPAELFVRVGETAGKYVDRFGEPDKCLFNRREYPLSSPQCENEILSRVQPIPAPLILAQAAQESGWGSKDNKWVSDYNNYLGLQIAFSRPSTMSCYKNCRCAGTKKTRCALRFTGVEGCFYEYSMRFNASSNNAYVKFRKARENLQNMDSFDDVETQCENARALVPHLKSYAEEEKYIHYICDRVNDDICEMLKKCPAVQSI